MLRILHGQVDEHRRGEVVDESAFAGRDLDYLLQVGAVERVPEPTPEPKHAAPPEPPADPKPHARKK